MARLTRICPIGIPQHIIQRGNNRQACFASEEDFIAYVHFLSAASKKYSVSIHAWVFMTNHVHLLATPQAEDSISKMMQAVGRQYVRYFNYTHGRSGTLWEGRFKSCVVDAEPYLLVCQRYIELNPVRAGMVDDPAKYRWSSFHANGLNKETGLRTPHELYQRLGRTEKERVERYKQLFEAQIGEKLLKNIRESVNRSLALGNDRFSEEVERLTGRRVTPLKPGPKPRPQQGG